MLIGNEDKVIFYNEQGVLAIIVSAWLVIHIWFSYF